jgi:NAD-dependent SIR2 family protein deacetylase
MAEETFTCDRCGNSFPSRQMKEAFRQDGQERVKMELCPTCLDEVMNEAGTVQGIAGEDKRAAVRIDADGSEGDRESFGQRS